MKDVLLPKPICIHASLNHSRKCVFAVGRDVRRTGRSWEKPPERINKNEINDQKSVGTEMSFPRSARGFCPNTRAVRMCFVLLPSEKSYQITSSVFYFLSGSHLSI